MLLIIPEKLYKKIILAQKKKDEHDLNYNVYFITNDTIKNFIIEDKTRKTWCFTKNINLIMLS